MAVADFIFNAYSSRPRPRSLPLSLAAHALDGHGRATDKTGIFDELQGITQSGGELFTIRLRRR